MDDTWRKMIAVFAQPNDLSDKVSDEYIARRYLSSDRHDHKKQPKKRLIPKDIKGIEIHSNYYVAYCVENKQRTVLYKGGSLKKAIALRRKWESQFK